ncbi:MaoC/PaaZ C-terminal domain-containing protein [Litorivivens sp.]|uniref:MaoC family dehydratase n=1 Tax=Litorivivens sp. TaxID=2020868 RepID=UPI0035623756
MTITLNFDNPPVMPKLLLRAALTRKAKSLKPTAKDVPTIAANLSRLQIDPSKLRSYNAVCGFPEDSDILPATYPHIAAFSLHMEMLLNAQFPFSPMGIVHLRNRIEQLRPIQVSETLSLHCTISDSRDTDLGLEVDIATTAKSGTEVVWTDLTTVLKRAPSRSGKPKRSTLETFSEREDWSLAANLGRRYARVSGDYNPIHLFPASAKLLGFKRHIAHGMWSKARCLAALQPKLNVDAFCIDVEFKTPVFLPTQVGLHYENSEQGIAFSLRNEAGNRPHVNGSLRAL